MAKVEIITSSANPLLKDVRRAMARGGLTEDGLCVAESFHLLEEALRSERDVPVVLAAESVRTTVENHVKRLSRVRVVVAPDELFQKLAGTEATQGVIALIRPPAWNLENVFRTNSLVVVLDGVQDPGNAGSIVRAAEAFGASGVLFVKGSVSPYNPKTLRASAGSLFRVPYCPGIDPVVVRAALQQRKLKVYAGAPYHARARSLRDVDLTAGTALIIGSEGRGVSAELRGAAEDLAIPTSGVESLNAAAAAAVLLYEASRQRALIA